MKKNIQNNHKKLIFILIFQDKYFSYVDDPSIADVFKYGDYQEHKFFDEVKTITKICLKLIFYFHFN